MAIEPRDIVIYTTAEGRAPFSDWIGALKDASARAAVRSRINRLRLGNFGDSKAVGGGISELRIDHGPGYRVYFAKDGAALVVLLSGGDKKSQQRDITRAQGYWLDYRSRSDD